MPNVKGFTPLADPSWITLEFDDGTVSNPVQDPTGEYRQQVTDIASKIMGVPPPSAMAGAVAGPGGGAAPVMPPPVTPEAASAWSAANAPAPPLAPQTAPAAPVAPAPVRPAAAAPAPATGAFPAPTPAPRGMVRAGVARSVTGMAEEDKANVDRLNTEAVEATGEANAATVKARLDQLNNDWNRISEREKGELAKEQLLKDKEAQFTERFEAQMAANKETAARPIDPAAAFDGDAGWYAFMAAFGDAIANFGANLAGRSGTADPVGRINQIIDRSVRLQTAQKQADFEAGKITADELEEERERIRLNITTVGEQLVRTQEARAQTQNERMGLDALGKTFRAQQADAMAKNATATARQETRQEQFAPVAPAKPADATDLLKIIREKKLLRQELGDNMTSMGMPPEQVEKALAEYDAKGITVSGKTTDQAAKELQTSLDVKKDLDTRRRHYSVEVTELADEETAMVAAAKALGGKYDPESGHLDLPDDLTGFGIGTAVRNIPGSQAKRAHEAIRNLTDVKQRMRSGAAAPVAEVAMFQKITAGDNFFGLDEDSVKAALKTTAASISARRRGAQLGAGQDVVQDWERQKRTLPAPIVVEDR